MKTKSKEIKKVVCNRCGNEEHLYSDMYFPFSKIRVHLCDICQVGIMFGLRLDSERMLRLGLKDYADPYIK